jgi:uncharacterized protein
MFPTLDVGGVHVSLFAAAALGAGVGIVAGLFGVGGGFLLVPALHVVLRVPLPLAVGASVCQMIGTAFSTFLRQRKQGQAEIRFDVLMLGGAMVGPFRGWIMACGGERVPFRLPSQFCMFAIQFF